MKKLLASSLFGLSAAVCLLEAAPYDSSKRPDNAAEIVAKGGRLYDKWYSEADLATPRGKNPLYPQGGKYARSSSQWRCKECHGWDYKGVDGAYDKTNKHFTGIKGILGTRSKPKEDLLAFLNKDEGHRFVDQLSKDELRALVSFIQHGQFNMDDVIDKKGKAKGDPVKGQSHYQSLCAACHHPQATSDDMPDLKALAKKNPWETLHKILFGQPNSEMPALQSLDRQISVDILRYLQQD